ncbi:RluA family pseudouridine synthase [Pleomorphomonas sp. NRK KF1]|uniref:RluA family pseudouridine synthase n=1 Tax=Pleomorphomonas sp. NRK KF1 TaxID=2943000 RepID=UPI002043765A|nr:RluA family pseudouridine synthase [Pleomorphomonas sp. NRK KF1]MCM5554883.1 RluA family pseudouridine synthase [Pleomorphomonas sp. NRK KF1]
MADEDDIVSEDDAGGARAAVIEAVAKTRFDKLVAEAFPDISRSRLKALIEAGAVAVDGTVVTDAARKMSGSLALTVLVPPAEDAEPQGESIPLDVVYEDDELIVIDKPAGLVVHPAAGNWTGTLVNALIAHCGDSLSGIGGVRRPGIVHRLDKDTTGLMVVAKTDRSHAGLAAQFADHGRTGPLERGYLALVWGSPEPFRGTIEAPLGRSSSDRTKMAIVKGSGGKEAITHYEVVERFPAESGRGAIASLVECHLETGRTHQIRVHLTAAGHPLVGDAVYGSHFLTKVNRLPEATAPAVRAFQRQALHAFLIAFEHPVTGELLKFESGLPPDMADLVSAFREL